MDMVIARRLVKYVLNAVQIDYTSVPSQEREHAAEVLYATYAEYMESLDDKSNQGNKHDTNYF